jgi:hypothetical protein
LFLKRSGPQLPLAKGAAKKPTKRRTKTAWLTWMRRKQYKSPLQNHHASSSNYTVCS